MENCLQNTKSGERCKNHCESNGICNVHNRSIQARKKKTTKVKPKTTNNKYDQVSIANQYYKVGNIIECDGKWKVLSIISDFQYIYLVENIQTKEKGVIKGSGEDYKDYKIIQYMLDSNGLDSKNFIPKLYSPICSSYKFHIKESTRELQSNYFVMEYMPYSLKKD